MLQLQTVMEFCGIATLNATFDRIILIQDGQNGSPCIPSIKLGCPDLADTYCCGLDIREK